jgi:undecaprenyl diphosphate synthase
MEAKAVQRLAGAKIPAHLAVIPDGNRRWAASHSASAVQGHRAGFEIAKRLSRFCRRIGIHTVTVWAFSTENWRRPPAEVAALMALFQEWLTDLLPEAIEEEVRVIHLGRWDGVPPGAEDDAVRAGFATGLPESLKDSIEEIETKTAGFEKNVINLAINYGGADEIARAIGHMFKHVEELGQDPASLDIRDFLDTYGQLHPNPDVVWRTSGELRSSGFLPIQAAYAEMIFIEKLFPDLTEEDVIDVVLEYSARARRFGG